MIRRLKHEVLNQLPEKQRQTIDIESNKTYVKEIKELMISKEIPLDILQNNEKLTQYGQNSDNFSPLNRCYLLTGLAKIEGVNAYLTSLLENDVKILIFAHHQAVLDEIEQHLGQIKVECIRIDGNTSSELRKRNIRNFQ